MENRYHWRHNNQLFGVLTMEEFLLILLQALNSIEVKGKENLVQLATAIMAAEEQLQKIRSEEAPDGE